MKIVVKCVKDDNFMHFDKRYSELKVQYKCLRCGIQVTVKVIP